MFKGPSFLFEIERCSR